MSDALTNNYFWSVPVISEHNAKIEYQQLDC